MSQHYFLGIWEHHDIIVRARLGGGHEGDLLVHPCHGIVFVVMLFASALAVGPTSPPSDAQPISEKSLGQEQLQQNESGEREQ